MADVTVSITSDSVGVQRAGFGKPLILSYNATFSERTRTYSSLSELAVDFATTTVEYLCASQIFAQEPCPEEIMIGRGALPPTVVQTIEVQTVRTNHTYRLHVEGEGVTTTDITIPTLTNQTFTSTHAAETITVASTAGMATGDGPVRLTTSAADLPNGYAENANYFLIVVDATTLKLAISKADALAGTPVTISDDGTGTHTLNTATNDVIVAMIVNRLNLVAGKNYTAANTGSTGSQDVTVTATAAGDWFSIEVLDPNDLESALTHVDPGVATDLAAILVEDDSWYTLLTNYNSNAYALAAAGWCETAGLKTYACDLAETDAENTAVGNSDTGDDLHTLNRGRTSTFHHRYGHEFFAASSMGRYLPYEPGEATLKFKTLSGVTAIAYTSTQRGRLEGRQMNYYRSQRGVSMIANGYMAGGTLPNWFDVRRDVDWLQDDQEAGVFAVLAAAAKVPFTDEGISIVLKEVRASLDRAVQRGIITAGYVLTAPLAADVSDADKLDRILPDIKWSATLAGAVHGVTISGVVSV